MADFRIVGFKTQYRNGKDPVDWVTLAPPGEGYLKTQSSHAVDKLRPPADVDDRESSSLSYQYMKHRWEVIEPAYKAWKKGEELPENGLPLAAWPGVTPDMTRALISMGLRTVEDVRDNPEAVAKLNFPNARKLSETAKAYLNGQDSAARDAENAELRDRIAIMEQMVKEAMEKNSEKAVDPENEDQEAAA